MADQFEQKAEHTVTRLIEAARRINPDRDLFHEISDSWLIGYLAATAANVIAKLPEDEREFELDVLETGIRNLEHKYMIQTLREPA